MNGPIGTTSAFVELKNRIDAEPTRATEVIAATLEKAVHFSNIGDTLSAYFLVEMAKSGKITALQMTAAGLDLDRLKAMSGDDVMNALGQVLGVVSPVRSIMEAAGGRSPSPVL